MHMNLGELCEIVRDRDAQHAAVHGITKSWKQPSDWTTTRGPSMPLLGTYLEELCNANGHSSTVYNSQDTEAI